MSKTCIRPHDVIGQLLTFFSWQGHQREKLENLQLFSETVSFIYQKIRFSDELDYKYSSDSKICSFFEWNTVGYRKFGPFVINQPTFFLRQFFKNRKFWNYLEYFESSASTGVVFCPVRRHPKRWMKCFCIRLFQHWSLEKVEKSILKSKKTHQ